MNNLVKVDPKEFGLEETKAQDIALQFKPMLDKMVELETEFNEVVKLDIENPETSKKAKELRSKYVKVRTGTAEIHKQQKAFYLAGGRFVDGWKNAQLFASQGKEEKLIEIEKYYENIEKQKLQALKQERVDMLKPYIDNAEELELHLMTEDVWEAYFMVKKKNHEERIEAERIAELQRIEEELRLEKEREAQRLENERLRKEAEKREKEIEAERKKQADIIAKQQREAQEKLDAERKERERIENELKAQKEAEAQRLRQEHFEAEKRRKEADKLAKAPIKKQLENWVSEFNINIPVTLNDNELANEILSTFWKFKSWATKEVEREFNN
jgi:hypothetical protein